MTQGTYLYETLVVYPPHVNVTLEERNCFKWWVTILQRLSHCYGVTRHTIMSQVEHWPKDQYSEFFNGDSYIILNTYKYVDDRGREKERDRLRRNGMYYYRNRCFITVKQT